MANGNVSSFFLGANAPSGFYSLYDWLIDLDTAHSVFIIKGGPGCGKSSFMRRISKTLVERGYDAEHIHCSADLDSLDGVVFPKLNIALVDGTAPHVVEPKYPSVVEHIVNLAQFYDSSALVGKRQAIIDAATENKEAYPRVYRYIAAARSLTDDIFGAVLQGVSIERIQKRARGIISREISRGPGYAYKKRFLSAITPQGPVCRFDTARILCSKIYEIYDNFGLSHFMLSSIVAAAQQNGHEVIACYCPLNPEAKLEHVLIPSLSLGFVTSSDWYPYDDTPYRRIRLDPLADSDVIRHCKQRIRFCKKASAAMLNEAVSALAECKLAHDRLESLYNPHVDFDGVYSLADTITESILASQ